MRLRLSTVAALACAGIAGFLLFQTSQNVQQAEDKLRVAHESLAKEESSVRVLETEWDYLNRPDRIEDLARQHLKMRATMPDALVKDSRSVTDPPPPIQKKAIPAVERVTAPVATSSVPLPPSISNNEHRQFDDLINDLAVQGPAVGGGQ